MTLLTYPEKKTVVSKRRILISKNSPKPSFKFKCFETEKNKSFSSFVIALVVHLFIFFGGQFAFVQAADYGIQGSSASIDVYMVAANPTPTRAQVPQEITSLMVKELSENEMSIPQPKKREPAPKKADSKPKMKEESKFVGDGSSKIPGQSVTTLFSQASSETAGKAGKYQNLPPDYPSIARENGWEGLVTLKVLIRKEGLPDEVKIEKSSGYKVLDHEALDTVKKWKFVPGHIGNVSVSSWIKIPIRFELEN